MLVAIRLEFVRRSFWKFPLRIMFNLIVGVFCLVGKCSCHMAPCTEKLVEHTASTLQYLAMARRLQSNRSIMSHHMQTFTGPEHLGQIPWKAGAWRRNDVRYGDAALR